jgi:hypothetical protein
MVLARRYVLLIASALVGHAVAAWPPLPPKLSNTASATMVTPTRLIASHSTVLMPRSTTHGPLQSLPTLNQSSHSKLGNALQDSNDSSNLDLPIGAAAVADEEKDKKWWQGYWIPVTTWAVWLYVVVSAVGIFWLYGRGYIDGTGSVRENLSHKARNLVTPVNTSQWLFRRPRRSHHVGLRPEDPAFRSNMLRLHREAISRELQMMGYA